MRKNPYFNETVILQMKKEFDDFRKAMAGVRLFVHDKVDIRPIYKKKTQKIALKSSLSSEPSDLFYLEDIPEKNITSEEKLFFARTGLQHKLVQKLKQGKMMPEASLDLHRLTAAQARKSVALFIEEAQLRHYRTVHIIHGKSKADMQLPILKNQVNHWLKQIPVVLAFCSALPQDGGTGAVYVLLKI
jgi:DNA-nicking Smr family endonuclease